MKAGITYDELKECRIQLEELVAEMDFKVKNFNDRAKQIKDKPELAKNCKAAAQYYERRLSALKAALILADAELLSYIGGR